MKKQTHVSQSKPRKTSRLLSRLPSLGPLSNLSWVKYDPGTALNLSSKVSPEAELAHRRLADYVWHEGKWPLYERSALAQCTRLDARRWHHFARELRAAGWRRTGIHFVNNWVGQIRRESAQAHQRRVAISSAGGKAKARLAADKAAQPEFDARKLFTEKRGLLAASLQQRLSVPTACPVQYSTVQYNRTVNAERLTRSVAPLKKASGGEKTFMGEVKETMTLWLPGSAAAELDNWGGWWRNRYREDHIKAGKVLAEIRCLVKESRIGSNPGKAAVDLWNRLPSTKERVGGASGN